MGRTSYRNNEATMRYLILALAILLAAPLTASAQEMKSIDMDYTYAKKDCPRVRTAGEATGVGLGAAASIAGSVTLAMGLDQDLSANTATRNRGMMAAGGALIGAGVGALITSAILLARKREKRAMFNEGMCAPVARRPFPGLRF